MTSKKLSINWIFKMMDLSTPLSRLLIFALTYMEYQLDLMNHLKVKVDSKSQ